MLAGLGRQPFFALQRGFWRLQDPVGRSEGGSADYLNEVAVIGHIAHAVNNIFSFA
jgi:hypothetical protein